VDLNVDSVLDDVTSGGREFHVRDAATVPDYYCRRESYRLHADIVMSLEGIFGYNSSKTGRIWTRLGRGMGNGEK